MSVFGESHLLCDVMLHVNSMSVFGESHLLCDVMLHVNSMSECQCLVKVICCVT